MTRRRPASMNVTIRQGLIKIIQEEVLETGYLGYATHAEVIHDGARLLVLLLLATKIVGNESIKNERLASLITSLRKHSKDLV